MEVDTVASDYCCQVHGDIASEGEQGGINNSIPILRVDVRSEIVCSLNLTTIVYIHSHSHISNIFWYEPNCLLSFSHSSVTIFSFHISKIPEAHVILRRLKCDW